MRNIPLAIVIAALPVSSALAEPPGMKPDKLTSSDKLLPLKRPGTGDSCAAFGPGFVKVDGADTCVKIGGAARIDVGGSR